MSKQFYENLFLVNNIPKIEGNQQIKDAIKKYAYTGEMYMILARKFSLKFILVLEAIENAFSRNNPINCECCREYRENDIHEENWVFAFNNYNQNIETLQMKAKNCYICGEYIYSETNIINLPFCNCDREL